MKNLIKGLLILSATILVFLLFAFISWSINPNEWDWFMRFMSGICMAFTIICLTGLVYLEEK